ncbi:hypothetical protein CMQ_1938 [Grosmannia clavigera kw1407]|uniref:Uncharacterized protein n=1 Tax=Grosmannia clavigera (strain kw1407 / UAMH 11150) TaxID=655863 RepID=F0XMW7_GROCL|nr:uncharacterized protein CMQ_1938 [Grosmannia clavigera kw1407]EFX00857.1 hypothetical protein CMQ_1938 [Grosmannia clavigera kw1407]
MHKWWAEGYFALKCLDITPVTPGRSTVSIQSHWMPEQLRVARKPRDSTKAAAQRSIWEEEIMLDQGQGETWLVEWGNRPRFGGPRVFAPGGLHAHGIVAAADPCTNRPLQTGRVFSTGAMSEDEAGKMRAMLDIQWACIQIACMSGAAGSPDFLIDSDDDDDDDDGGPVASPTPSVARLEVED